MSAITTNSVASLKALSAQDFQTFGTGIVGYIRPVEADGKPAFGLFAADGSLLIVHSNPELAKLDARHNGMEALTLQ